MINSKAKEFIKCLICSREYGFADLAILTHAWHESAGFAKAIGQWNLWGIKTPTKSVWNGLIVEVITHEYEPIKAGETEAQALTRIIRKYGIVNASLKLQGRNWYVSLPQKFRDWPTCEQAILWYCDFIQRLYPAAYQSRQNPEAFFKGLVSGSLKYATDPKYVSKLIGLYKELAANKEIRALLG